MNVMSAESATVLFRFLFHMLTLTNVAPFWTSPFRTASHAAFAAYRNIIRRLHRIPELPTKERRSSHTFPLNQPFSSVLWAHFQPFSIFKLLKINNRTNSLKTATRQKYRFHSFYFTVVIKPVSSGPNRSIPGSVVCVMWSMKRWRTMMLPALGADWDIHMAKPPVLQRPKTPKAPKLRGKKSAYILINVSKNSSLSIKSWCLEENCEWRSNTRWQHCWTVMHWKKRILRTFV